MKATALISIEVQIDLGLFARHEDVYKHIEALVEQHKQTYKDLLGDRTCSIRGDYDVEYSKEELQQMDTEDNRRTKIRELFHDKLEHQMNAIDPYKYPTQGCVSFIDGLYNDVNVAILDILDKPYITGEVIMQYNGHESPLLVDPTIAMIMIHFNRLIELSGDHHHVFLERITQIGNTNQYRISTGS